MELAEWIAWKQKTIGDIAVALKVEKDTVRAWTHGRTPKKEYREKIFVLTKGHVSWDKFFEDHPDTVKDKRKGGYSVKGR